MLSAAGIVIAGATRDARDVVTVILVPIIDVTKDKLDIVDGIVQPTLNSV